jgi:hypothetical protein
MNVQMNGLLEQIRTQLEAEGDAWNVFDDYLSSVLDALLVDHDLNEEHMLDIVFSAAQDWVDAGKLPEIPDDSADASEVDAWVAAAKDADFLKAVVAAAEDIEDDEDEDEDEDAEEDGEEA